MPGPLPAGDLATVAADPTLWRPLRDARLFVTGGTGFFGVWLLSSLLAADRVHDLGLRATVLTRGPDAFASSWPHLAKDPRLTFVPGDVRRLPETKGPFSHVLHAAGSSNTALHQQSPAETESTIVDGAAAVADLARRADTKRLLFTSSGAVYGPQPPDLERIPEDYAGRPDPVSPAGAYGRAKWAAERHLTDAGTEAGFVTGLARCFAFVGPGLPLDANFAVGNFLHDALQGRPVQVAGDGTPLRSYLYASDLTVWLMTILDRGSHGRPYNVGAEEALSIATLGHLVGAQFGVPVRIAKPAVPGAPPMRYIPSTARARTELGLTYGTALPAALQKTHDWLHAQGPSAWGPSDDPPGRR